MAHPGDIGAPAGAMETGKQGCGTGKFEDGSGSKSDILSDYGSGSSSGSGPYACIYIYI